MGDDRTETLTRLFAEITGLIEDAHETAIAGQSAHLARSKLADHALRLEQTARDIAMALQKRLDFSGHASVSGSWIPTGRP